MLESIVLHQSGTGVRGGDGNVVGISWKTLTRSHPSPSLVVTCTHQVVVYKPGESRRTHQWSFKPSAATALSHAAVFLPAGSRYVGVQQGSTLVSWRESELDVKRPLSAQASGAVQAVHACPQLGDYFVAVLSSGGVALYQGGLQLAARCDEAAGGSVSASASPANAKTRARAGAQVHAKAVWSGVRGNKVLVLENIGATNRITTFVLSAPPPQRRTNASAGADAASASPSASVTLVSSHALTKPLSLTGAPEEEEASTTACAAAFLGGEGEGGRGVVSVAWRTSRGPAWTKVVLDAAGAREELARPVATMAAAAMVECNGNGSGGVSNGHGGSPKKASARSKKSAEAGNSGGVDGWGSVPAVASADGGRLLVHSGGATPRLAIWDASYGVLLDDDGAPGSDVGGKAVGKAVSMVVSGDGAHVGISAAGRVLICPLPVKEAGTLASLLRRKRPSSSSAVATAAAAGGGRGGGGLSGLAFPSVDLARNGPASSLLGRSGALEAAEWEAAVVTPFREAEAKVIQSLHTAARWKDRDAFERVLREHGQRRASAAAAAGGVPSGDVAEGGVGEGGQEGRKRRRRREEREGADYSPGVVAAAVELCLKNPEAGLWNSLAVLVRSGGVSARHHRGLVASIVEHASPELLEEVMLHVPDLPEADAVRILRHFLAQAAASAEELPSVAAAAAAAAVAASGAALVASAPPPTDSAGVLHPAKRARGAAPIAGTGIDGGVDGIAVEVLSSPKRGGGGDGKGTEKDESASTSKKSKKSKKEDKKRRKSAALDSATLPAPDAMDEEEEVTENAGRHNKHANGVVAPNLSNGNGVHAAAATAVATQEDRGTSGDSGGCSNNETQDADSPPGTGDANNPEKNKKKRARAGGVGSDEDTPAARAERGVRVALMFPHNEAFLRSALAGLSHGEVVVVLKVLTRLIAEGRTKESSARSAVNRRGGATKATHGLPPARTDLVLGWAAAVLDAHFARLAVGGAADAGLVSALKALKRATRGEAICCELLCEVRSLVDELGRQHAAAAAAAAAVSAASKRHPKRDLFTLRVLRF